MEFCSNYRLQQGRLPQKRLVFWIVAGSTQLADAAKIIPAIKPNKNSEFTVISFLIENELASVAHLLLT